MRLLQMILPLSLVVLFSGCLAATSDDLALPDSELSGSESALSDEGAPPAQATFGKAWAFALEGEPVRGGRLEIHYDVSRLPQCRDTRYGQPAWSILARYRWPSGATGYVVVTNGKGTLDLSESGELELWFENQGYYGCRAFDSRYGENYRIEVAD
jgi:hypothetical protein